MDGIQFGRRHHEYIEQQEGKICNESKYKATVLSQGCDGVSSDHFFLDARSCDTSTAAFRQPAGEGGVCVYQAYNWIQSKVCKGDEYASEAGFDCSSISTTPPILSHTNPPIFLPTNSPIFSPTIDGDLLDDLLDVILVRLMALGLKVYTQMWCLIQQKIICKQLIGCCQKTWRMNESAQ